MPQDFVPAASMRNMRQGESCGQGTRGAAALPREPAKLIIIKARAGAPRLQIRRAGGIIRGAMPHVGHYDVDRQAIEDCQTAARPGAVAVRALQARYAHAAEPHRDGAADAVARATARQCADAAERLLLRPA